MDTDDTDTDFSDRVGEMSLSNGWQGGCDVFCDALPACCLAAAFRSRHGWTRMDTDFRGRVGVDVDDGKTRSTPSPLDSVRTDLLGVDLATSHYFSTHDRL